MRIIGRHRDYYDWVAAYGVDPALCYVRRPLTVPYGEAPAFARFSIAYPFDWALSVGTLRVSACTIGIFPNLYRRRLTVLRRPDNSLIPRTFLDNTELRAYLTEQGVTLTRSERYYLFGGEQHGDGPWPHERWRALGAPIFFAGEIGYRDQQIELGAPDELGLLTLDPILQDLRFTEVDPTDVFQRIQNFLRLDPDPGPAFSDAHKLQAHGFDQRSFRKRRDEEA
ncbi:MAG: hypothetical protein R3F60_30110 [bacterium]